MSSNTNEKTFIKWLREPQTLIGMSAIILSICGLFISLYEASLIRQHQRASVWPNIEITPSIQKDNVAFHIQNTGIGPARIKAATLLYKGHHVESWPKLLEEAEISDKVGTTISDLEDYYSFINEKVLPPNSDRVDIFRLYKTGSSDTGQKFLGYFKQEIANKNININLCYCSVYDQCWVTTMIDQDKDEGFLPSGQTKKVQGCKEIANSDI